MPIVAMSLGSNIDREKNIRFAVKELESQFGEIVASPVYLAQAVGFEGPSFYNLAVLLETELPMESVMAINHAIEAGAGRLRGEKSYGSRTLDIDILLYGEESFRGQGRNIPRDEIENAAYVLKPLLDILPDGTHPVSGELYADLWAGFEPVGDGLQQTDFDLRLL
ncbi:MAG: 2-amino-4-hydroxy-6-hydroxymethyldihydropteridine diphosphokinase [Saprospiraceae bacterium]|jgi:2-amino-4-hydroxy-6-hydroxymethyldihydropteridine diphosphokinase